MSYFENFEKYSYPGGHGTQSVADLAPSWSLYLPSGQASFCLEPRGQYPPAGHNPPVRPPGGA